jgi:hypothetical protein
MVFECEVQRGRDLLQDLQCFEAVKGNNGKRDATNNPKVCYSHATRLLGFKFEAKQTCVIP